MKTNRRILAGNEIDRIADDAFANLNHLIEL